MRLRSLLNQYLKVRLNWPDLWLLGIGYGLRVSSFSRVRNPSPFQSQYTSFCSLGTSLNLKFQYLLLPDLLKWINLPLLVLNFMRHMFAQLSSTYRLSCKDTISSLLLICDSRLLSSANNSIECVTASGVKLSLVFLFMRR